MFFLLFNSTKDRDLGIRVIKRPSIPSPKKKLKQITIDGKDGDSYIDEGTYEDIAITIEYNFVDRNNFNEKCRKIKKWVNKISDNKLSFSDDLEVFYKVKKVEIDDIERVYKVIGKFNITFICDPYTYYSEGIETLTLASGYNIYNENEVSKPTYVIKGNGFVTLIVNGISTIINVGQEVTLDTNLELCFKNNAMINLVLQSGTFEDLYLKEGQNIITYSIGTGGTLTSITMIPNWRTI